MHVRSVGGQSTDAHGYPDERQYPDPLPSLATTPEISDRQTADAKLVVPGCIAVRLRPTRVAPSSTGPGGPRRLEFGSLRLRSGQFTTPPAHLGPFYVAEVRHEWPSVRGRVRDPPRWSVAAGR